MSDTAPTPPRSRTSWVLLNTSPLLNYTIEPNKVFVSSAIDLLLTATVPDGSDPITFKSGRDGDEIDINFLSNTSNPLVDKQNFTCKSQTPGFTCAFDSANAFFVINPVGTQTLQPGQNIEVNFTTPTINANPGKSSVGITEYIGTNQGSTSIGVEKLKQELNIIAWINPSIIGLNGDATLYWQSFGGTKVIVSNFPENPPTKEFPVEGNPPYTGNTTITIGSNTAIQRIYNLTVTTNDNQSKTTPATLTQQPPILVGPTTSTPGPIKVNADATLTWSSLYGTTAYLTKPDGQQATRVDLNPTSPITITPGLDIYKASADGKKIEGSAVYSVSVQGFKKPDSNNVTIKLAPINYLYFKYSDAELTKLVWAVDTPSWPGVRVVIVENLSTMTIYQPGQNPTVLYLGSDDKTHPQIQYFNSTAPASGKVTLSWITANTKSLVLTPGNVTIAADKIAKGSLEVSPSGTTNYLLLATAANESKVTSALTVTVS